MLEHKTDLAIARGVMSNIFLLIQHASRIGHFKAGDDPQQGRFARAGRAEQREQRSVGHLETDIVEGDEAPEAFQTSLISMLMFPRRLLARRHSTWRAPFVRA